VNILPTPAKLEAQPGVYDVGPGAGIALKQMSGLSRKGHILCMKVEDYLPMKPPPDEMLGFIN
jgi:hypothetical protein